LVAIYPAGNIAYGLRLWEVSDFLWRISSYLLAFYLYLFLFLLIFDFLLLVNLIFKIVPSDILNRTKFKFAGLSAISMLSMAVIIAGIINFITIRISEYSINVPRRNSTISNLRIAFVADFHLQEETNIDFVKRFVKIITHIQPDIMLFGGDIIDGHEVFGNMIPYAHLFREIQTVYGSFGVYGNHEYYSGQDKGSFFDSAAIQLLRDTVLTIDHKFVLAGRNDSYNRARKTIGEIMKYTSDSLPLILLDHRPTEIDLISKYLVDIQLSGHTHNGQLFPINLIMKKIYPLSWGHKKIRNTHLFVTSGIRLWGIPVRTTGKSEIMVIDVHFKD
jgi:predicted MPP superfamily phosphohydrolase